MTPKPRKSKLPVYLFGRAWPSDMHQAACALECFRKGFTWVEPKTKQTWTRFEFFRFACQWLVPSIKWEVRLPDGRIIKNHWMERMFRSLCDESYISRVGDSTFRAVTWTGCGAAGKTFASGLFAYIWWLASPGNSSVTLTSTSKDAISQRVWPVFQKLHHDILTPGTDQPHEDRGHLIDSVKKLQAVKGDDKHAIHALAVVRGELNRAVDNIKGRHTERMMIIVDEANTTPAAIFEALPNATKGAKEFIVLVIGNALSHLDNHGRCAEPEAGWEQIDLTTSQWRTKGIPEWSIEPGICMHFDGNDSPNVLAAKTVFPYLYSYENFLRRKHNIKTPMYWSNERGFWPKAGLTNCILDEVLVEKYNGRGTFTFASYSHPLAFMDPAFGGDDCIIRFGLLGDYEGRRCILLTDSVKVEIDVEDTNEADYQIARRFIKECASHGVEPRLAGLDATGPGRGAYAIIANEWSRQVVRVEFGGAPSEMPASGSDPRPAKDVYDRKVSELNFSVREILCAGQLRGMEPDEIIQGATREYSLRGSKIRVDPKDECKKKLGRSPDNFDALAGLCHVARLNGLVLVASGEAQVSQDWTELAKSVQADSNYAEQAEPEALDRFDLEDLATNGSLDFAQF